MYFEIFYPAALTTALPKQKSLKISTVVQKQPSHVPRTTPYLPSFLFKTPCIASQITHSPNSFFPCKTLIYRLVQPSLSNFHFSTRRFSVFSTQRVLTGVAQAERCLILTGTLTVFFSIIFNH